MTDNLNSEEQSYADFLASQKGNEKPVEKVEEAPAAESPAETAAPVEAVAADSAEAERAEELFPGYSALPDEARAAIDQIVAERDAERTARTQVETKYQSERNMLVPAQRKVRELERKLEQISARPQTAAKPPAPDDRVKKLQSDLPDEFAAIDEHVTAKLTPIERKLQELEEQRQEIELQREQERAIADLNGFDPDWHAKTQSSEFSLWRQAICNEADPECYDPMLAEAIHRAAAGFDSRAMKSILRQFNRDLAEAQAAREQKPATVRKPEKDFSTRSPAVAASAKPSYASKDEQDYAEWLAAQQR